jgi:YkoY family integral membrane protein
VPALFHFITDFFASQKFSTQDLAVVGVLTVLEGVLSIDNALVLSLLAKRLPKEFQSRGLNWGMIFAFVFRFVAIFMASLLLRWTIVKFLGGAYLVYIAVRHLFFETKHLDEEKVELGEDGNPELREASGQPLTESETEDGIRGRVPVYVKPDNRSGGASNFWPTVASIALTDIAFAVDSILAAIALVGPPPALGGYHPRLWVVFAGGGLGMIVLRFAAGLFIKLMERFPRFELSAYLLVLVIGSKLLADWGLNSDWSFDRPQWAARALGGWKQSFETIETQRRALAADYEEWLNQKWILTRKTPQKDAKEAEEAAPPPVQAGQAEHPPAEGGEPAHPAHKDHVPHLLDFHNILRPESIIFWLLMVVSFFSGFLPPRKQPQAKSTSG